MAATFSIADYIVFSIFLLLSAAIGVYYGCTGGKQKTATEFLMANRQMSLLPASMSILASFLSGIAMLGSTAESYKFGTMYLWVVISYVTMIALTAHIYIPVFFNMQLTSAYEYLEKRFSRGVRTYASSIYIVQMLIYMALVVYAPALALSSVTGIGVELAAIITGVVCAFYTTLGGMKAVMWTDTMQIFVMFSGLLAVLIVGTIKQGGFEPVWNDALASGRLDFYNWEKVFNPSPLERHTFWTLCIGGTFSSAAIYAVNQAQVQRALTMPSLSTAKKAFWINAPGQILFVVVELYIGLVMYSFYKGCDPISNRDIANSDQLLPHFVMDIMQGLEGIPGLFTAAIYSGALSTLSSGLNSVAAVTLEDIVKTFINPNISDEKAAIVSKVMACFYGLVVIGLTFVAALLGGVLQAAISLFGMLGGPLLGVFSYGMFFPWANTWGAYAGLSAGLGMTLWVGIGQQIYKPSLYFYPVSAADCPNVSISSANTTFASTSSSLSMMDSTTAVVNAGDVGISDGMRAFYSLSYQWFSALGVFTVIIVGHFFTFCGRAGKGKDIGSGLLSPPLVRLYRWLPPALLWGYRIISDDVKTAENNESQLEDKEFEMFGKTKPTLPSNSSQVELLSAETNVATDN